MSSLMYFLIPAPPPSILCAVANRLKHMLFPSTSFASTAPYFHSFSHASGKYMVFHIHPRKLNFAYMLAIVSHLMTSSLKLGSFPRSDIVLYISHKNNRYLRLRIRRRGRGSNMNYTTAKTNNSLGKQTLLGISPPSLGISFVSFRIGMTS